MRLLFIRHGDPDYVNDSLTKKGRREAECLAELAPALDLGEVYASPMGRAQETASFSLRKTGKTAVTVPWLMEFLTGLDLNRHPELRRAYGADTPKMAGRRNPSWMADREMQASPGQKAEPAGQEGLFWKDPRDSAAWEALNRGLQDPTSRYSYTQLLHPEYLESYLPDADGRYPEYASRIIWDILPSYAAEHPELFDPEDWKRSDIASAGHVEEFSEYVFAGFDGMLKEHGYVRDGLYYRVTGANEGTVTCFCQLGLTCLLVSHLMNISPFTAMQAFAFAPTSVTEFVTEERQKGLAQFRALRLGDISPLTMGKEKPSFSARFCETYDRQDQRH